jgi:rhodanese-related sulfurtransferase
VKRTCSSFFETRMVTSERKGSLGTAAPCGAREVDDDDDDNDEVAAELRRLPDFTVLDRSLGGFGSDMQITLLCSVGERKRAAAGGGRRAGYALAHLSLLSLLNLA